MPNPVPLPVDSADAALLCDIAALPDTDAHRKVLDEVFARQPDGTPLNLRCDVASVDVTGSLIRCVLTWLYLAYEPHIMWTTFDADTARLRFSELFGVIDSIPELRSRVAKISRANGEQRITLTTGPQLMMQIRRRGLDHLRGYSGILIIDQAGSLREPDRDHLSYLTGRHAFKQVLYGYGS